MADAQAETAPQGQPPEGAAPKTGDEPRMIPEPRLKEVIADVHQTREELAATRAELAASRAELASLRAAQQAPQDRPLDDDDPDKVVERTLQRLLTKNNEQYNRVLIGFADRLDAAEFRQSAADPDEAKAAEELRERALKNGISLSRKDALKYRLGEQALEQREKAAADEAARIKANVYAFAGEDRPGSSRPPPEPDLDHLPPAERADAYAKRLGDAKI